MRSLETLVPAPVVALVVAAVMHVAPFAAEVPAAGSLRDVVYTVIAIASGIIATAAFHAFWRARTTFDPRHPERASVLLTRGVFGLTRNPLYLSLALLLLAYGVRLGSWMSLTGVPLFVVYVTRFQIVPEERALQLRFGAAWTQYARKVRRWI